VPKEQLCQRHYEEWLHKYFFKAPVLVLNKQIGSDNIRQTERTTCFKKLILGHPRSLSQLSFRSPHFAWHVRTLRDRVWIKTPLARQISVPAHDVHHVSVLLKGSGWHTQNEWVQSCADTGATLQDLGLRVRLLELLPADPRSQGGSDSEQGESDARFQEHLNVPARGDEDAHVRCHEPGALPFEQQVALSRKTTTTVSFHGTVSYLVLFQRDGTSAVIVGRPPLKETDVMLHLTHVHVLYVKLEQVQRDYTPALRSSLKHVDRSLRHAT
jgi:hypothetical protein